MIFMGREITISMPARHIKIVRFFTFICKGLICRFYQKVKSDIFWQIHYYAMNNYSCAKK